MQGTLELAGDTSEDGHAPGPADCPSAGQLPRRRSANHARAFRTENPAPGRPDLAAKVDRFSARVAERAWRGGVLTATERGALLELIQAIAILLDEDG